MNNKVEAVVFGDLACFTMSESKVDRVTYDLPTPSACRGIIEAIYCEPKEFWYEIRGIDILKPIRHYSMTRNEITKKVSFEKGEAIEINTIDCLTQRTTVFLKDVAYKITAELHVRDTYRPDHSYYDNLSKLKGEFSRRLRTGKHFDSPYLGLRECMAFCRPAEPEDIPIQESGDFGTVLYDIFDPENSIPLNTDPKALETCRPHVTYFHAIMDNGHIAVPKYSEIIKERA